MPQPTVGRQVHFVDADGVHRSATISDLTPDAARVDLHVLMPDQARPVQIMHDVPLDEDTHSPITWHWPERT